MQNRFEIIFQSLTTDSKCLHIFFNDSFSSSSCIFFDLRKIIFSSASLLSFATSFSCWAAFVELFVLLELGDSSANDLEAFFSSLQLTYKKWAGFLVLELNTKKLHSFD